MDAPLEVVYIYFGTETYDEYERDVKVKPTVDSLYSRLESDHR